MGSAIGTGAGALAGAITVASSISASAVMGSSTIMQGTSASYELSKNTIKHLLNNHCIDRTIQRMAYESMSTTVRFLESKTFFNPEWSEQTIIDAAGYAYNEAVSAGVKNGTYECMYLGENVIAYLIDGKLSTAYGTYVFSYEDLLKMIAR